MSEQEEKFILSAIDEGKDYSHDARYLPDPNTALTEYNFYQNLMRTAAGRVPNNWGDPAEIGEFAFAPTITVPGKPSRVIFPTPRGIRRIL